LSKPCDGEEGTVDLRFILSDPTGERLEMKATAGKVRVTKSLLDFLRQDERIEYRIN
jgi:hypothetical protein